MNAGARPEISKDETRHQAITFFHGCRFRRCLSPDCPNYFLGARRAELRVDTAANLPAVLQLLADRQLLIFCHQPNAGAAVKEGPLAPYAPLAAFSLLEVFSRDAAERVELFAGLRELVEQKFLTESYELRSEVVAALDAGLAVELRGVEHALASGEKSEDLLQTLALFFLVFGSSAFLLGAVFLAPSLGVEGLAIAYMAALYTFLKYAKARFMTSAR